MEPPCVVCLGLPATLFKNSLYSCTSKTAFSMRISSRPFLQNRCNRWAGCMLGSCCSVGELACWQDKGTSGQPPGSGALEVLSLPFQTSLEVVTHVLQLPLGHFIELDLQAAPAQRGVHRSVRVAPGRATAIRTRLTPG